jgi:hypothetical protein
VGLVTPDDFAALQAQVQALGARMDALFGNAETERQLHRRLESKWLPEPASLMLPNSIPADLLAKGSVLRLTGESNDLTARFGTGSFGSGAAAVLRSFSVSHGLGKTPRWVWAGVANSLLFTETDSYTATQFTLNVSHIHNVAWSGGYAYGFIAVG